ncbi:unnamed protein product [Calypogeia fissa]
MNGRDERFHTVAFGLVVDITIGRQKCVNVIVENFERQKWFRIELPVQCFSPLMNVNWFARGEASVLSMGFLPEHVMVEKIKKGEVSVFPVEFVQGFRYVRKYMATGTIDVYNPLTWEAYSDNILMGTKIGKWLVFDAKTTTEDVDRVDERNQELQAVAEEAVPTEEVQEVDPTNDTKKRKPEAALTSRSKKRATRDTIISKEKAAPKSRAQKKAPAKPRAEKAALKGKGTKAAKTLTSNAPASTERLVVHLSDDESIEAPEEAKIMEGREVLQMMEKYYTFGIKSLFSIPVELILPAPARLCYRMLNRDHVKQITDSMIENPGMEPQVADLILYNATMKKLVSYTGTDVDKQDLIEAVKKRKIQFLAISGQHSARAAKNVLEFAKKDAKIQDLANRLRFHKARILSDKTPATVLAEHLQRSNTVNTTMEYKSCFLDTIVHARRKFDKLGRPKRPVVGDNKTNATENSKFQVYD